MNKTDKIFSCLPELYQNIGKESIIYRLVDIFGKKLQCIEDDIFEVMQAHWINHADRDKKKINDLSQLGSLFDIRPIEGELVEEYRRRLKKMIKVYLDGVGTTKAIIETVAAVFGWDVCPKITLPNTTRQVDRFTTIAQIVDFGKKKPCDTPEDCQVDDIKQCPFKKVFDLEIIDNPENPTFRKVTQDEINKENWEVTNYGIYKVTPSITIKASKKIANPVITNKTTGQTVVYVGVIPQGGTLKIIPWEKAVLEATDVADKIFYLAGGRFDEDKFNSSVFERVEKGLFGTELDEGKFEYTKFDSSRFSPVEKILSPPGLPPGKTQWSSTVLQVGTSIYDSLKERFEESLFEEAVFDHSSFDIIAINIQEDKKIYGEIRLDWIERQTATFMVRLPRNLQDLLAGSLEISDLRELLEKEIRKVKAAGVEAIIEYVLKPFEEIHKQISELSGIENQIPLSEKHELGESLKIELEGGLEESHPIVDRFTVTSEIRSKELQSQGYKFGVEIDYKWRQHHEQVEKILWEMEVMAKENHLIKDGLVVYGAFDVTCFDNAYFVPKI